MISFLVLLLVVLLIFILTLGVEFGSSVTKFFRNSAEAKHRKMSYRNRLENFGPAPACQIAEMTARWVGRDGLADIPMVAVTTDKPIFEGMRMVAKKYERNQDPISSPDAFQARYDLIVSRPGLLAHFSRDTREILLRVFPCTVDENQILIKMNSVDCFDIHAEPFVNTWP